MLGPEVVRLPLVDGTDAVFTTLDVDGWTDAYPAVNVPHQLRRMREWILANPSRRKTKRGIKAFVVSWLGREQDRGGGNGHSHEYRPTGRAANFRAAMAAGTDEAMDRMSEIMNRKPKV